VCRYVIRQGEKGDSFFIIERGEARVTKSKKPGKGKEKDITTLARGA
jgi:CRP-like cAMP-binding protein